MDAGNNRVEGFDNSGKFITNFGMEGAGNGEFEDPYGIVVSGSGVFYVVDQSNDRVEVFDLCNAVTPIVTLTLSDTGTPSPSPSSTPTATPSATLTSSPTATPTATATSSPTVTPTDSPTLTPTPVLCYQYASEFGNGKFVGSRGMAVTADGHSYVSDVYLNTVQEFDASGVPVTQWGSTGSGNGQFSAAYGVALAPNGDVYVTDANNNRVQVFKSDGTYMFQFGNGVFSAPTGIAISSLEGGVVYVADYYNNRIVKFDLAGNPLFSFGNTGGGGGSLNGPQCVTVDSSGNVYVVDSANYLIQKFSSSGTPITQWGGYGTGNGQFSGGFGTCVNFGDYVFATDAGSNRIEKFDTSGNFLTQFGNNGGSGQLNGPFCVATDGIGNVYVTDQGNNRVVVYDSCAGGSGGFAALKLQGAQLVRSTAIQSPTLTPTHWWLRSLATASPTATPTASPTATATGTPTASLSPTPAQGTMMLMAAIANTGDVSLGSGAWIDDGAKSYDFEVVAAKEILLGSKAYIAGRQIPNAPMNLAPMPAPEGLESSGSLDLNSKQTRILTAGDYLFDEVNLDLGSTLQCSGTVRVWVSGNLTFNGVAGPFSGVSNDFRIYGVGRNSGANFGSKAEVTGLIYMPDKPIKMGASSALFGAAIGSSVELGAGAWITYDDGLKGAVPLPTLGPIPSTESENVAALGLRSGKSSSQDSWLPAGRNLISVPNPAKNQAIVVFRVAEPSLIQISLFDISGTKVISKVSGQLAAGIHFEPMDLRGMSSGLYFVVATSQDDFGSRTLGTFKMAVVK